MTTKEIEQIAEAIETCRLEIERSFDKFSESIKSPEQRQLEAELKEEAGRLTSIRD